MYLWADDGVECQQWRRKRWFKMTFELKGASDGEIDGTDFRCVLRAKIRVWTHQLSCRASFREPIFFKHTHPGAPSTQNPSELSHCGETNESPSKDVWHQLCLMFRVFSFFFFFFLQEEGRRDPLFTLPPQRSGRLGGCWVF